MMIQKKTGVIVFLDALGVSYYKKTDQFLHFAEELEILKGEANTVWKKWKKDFEKDGVILPDPDLAFFQDSLIICFPEPMESAEKSLHNFFAAQNWVMQFIVQAIGREMYFRGAMAHGEYIFNESKRSISVLGEPVVNAYKLEKLGNWIGVIQTPEFQEKYLRVLAQHAKNCGKTIDEIIQSFNRFYVKYDVPLKENGKTFNCFVVNWATIVGTKSKDKVIMALTSGADNCHSQDIFKYLNTVKFFTYCELNHFFLD